MEEIRRGVLVLEERPGEAITRQAAFMLRSQLVYLSDYSTLTPTLVTSRFGPSNGAVTTALICLP